MARVAASVAIFLFLLFTFSRAREIHHPFPQSKPDSGNANQIQQHDTVSFTLDTADPVVPLTFVTFRPINRHVPRNPLPLPLSLRIGNRRCRHGHRREIPYGNDAIVKSDAAVDPSNRGAVRQIPTRWVRFQGGARMRFPEMIPSQHHLLVHRKEHEEGGWFSNKIRMFLNMFRF